MTPGSARLVLLRALVLPLFSLTLAPATASAQLAKDSYWTMRFSVTPTWKDHGTLAEQTLGWSHPLEGSEFTIGMGRGRIGGGDWSVSYVSKPLDDGTFTEVQNQSGTGFSSTITETTTLRDARIKGVEVNWFKPFGTIANRVQVGISAGGGVGKVHGTVDTTYSFDSTVTNPLTGAVLGREVSSNTESDEAANAFYKVVPLFKVEAQAAFIIAPAFKLVVAGGLNNPGIAMRVGGLVLIGAH